MFSTDNNTCGSNCNSKRSKRSNLENDSNSVFGGWTPYYNDDDDPTGDGGTGDHEHYFYFRNWNYRGVNAAKKIAYGKDGQAYRNCNRTAIFVREKYTHV